MNWDSIQQLVRIAMQMVAGYLVSIGWPEDMTMLVAGIGTSAAALAWWFFWNRTREDVPA